MPDDLPAELDPIKTKEKRTQDAEKIRQDFIKSQRLPGHSSAEQQPESTEDEY